MTSEPSIFDEVDEAFETRRQDEARADIEAGRLVSHEQVRAWLETWGAPDEEPPPESWFR
jgi:predicted transcriptional regulator